MAALPLGVQLYTLREDTEKDFLGTLKKKSKRLATMGSNLLDLAVIPPQKSSRHLTNCN